MKTRSFLLLCLAAAPAMAQTLKPGLWELDNRIASASPEMMAVMAAAQQQMANMAPEQRKAMEQMMARHGVNLGLGDNGGVKLTYCLTKDMADKQDLPAGQPGQCTTTRTPVPGGLNVTFNCTRPPSSGNGQVIFNGNTAYSMRMNVNSSAQGKPQNMVVEGSGRWLGADCGSVAAPAPAAPPSKPGPEVQPVTRRAQ
ncbi:DUF3617 domain-containing protein [Duganella sp. Root1480D1]|uniref:DUF3617 domain-containing protein n=1 Tax=Duganella sp. Root1480D1 TaxID=1736471 RepID=UPI00070DC733|nr:DUF3617 domain-containing protein [Duganella sp. Root1480D1]KQZ30390.1 hypothetical protein ASD58_10245 [Duganella sp. Root1480D1]